MRVLCASGGSTKGIQLAIAIIEVFKNGFKPDIIAATSVSSIIALPLVMGMYDEVIEETSSVEPKELFKIVPVNKKGITGAAKWRVIKGLIGIANNYSLGVQDTRHFIKRYITEEMFNEYKSNADMPEIITMSVNFDTGLPILYYAKSQSYEEYVESVEKASHIPVMTDAVGSEVDGGNWAHNPEWYLLHEGVIGFNTGLKELISIYSREKVFKLPATNKWRRNLPAYITRTLDVFNTALSTSGQAMAYWYCKANNIKHLQLFCPQILDETYDFDLEQLTEAKEETLKSIREQIACHHLT